MSSPAEDAVRLLQAGGYTAAVAVPLAVVCGWLARRRFGSLCPRWRMPPFVWPGLVIFTFFLGWQVLVGLAIPLLDQLGFFRAVYGPTFPPMAGPVEPTDREQHSIALGLRGLWAQLLVVPVFVGGAAVLRSQLFRPPPDWIGEARRLPRSVALGLLGWATFGVLAYALNVGLNFLFDELGWSVTEHPLSKMGTKGDGFGGLLLVLSACVAAPLVEEFLYRGLLVPWAGERWYRPWCLLFPAAVLTIMQGGKQDGSFHAPSLAFVLVLAAGAYLVQKAGRWRPGLPARTGVAVWSSAALFAAAHSSVWPTPIPLFVLALGLGYLAARTRSWAAPAVAHAAFNAVSTVWVFLRG
ncbi:MAG: CPBP family glutamic-type intramembrane protease [Fimbriiglobus sp.]|jgi:membrane protease YdiL (CAAX protease family)|nr:CPBP family glutamic-type intramembrane protease [Fimbriiglobus sp.]